ncbi:MAG TPA: response regulator [Anaerolineae bacterium]|nr:response regulator [Anaerolineae bacterium]
MDLFPILLVEDSKHDVRFVKRAFKMNNIPNPLHVVPHGQACLDYLYHRGDYTDHDAFPRPGIILMDIRMPVMDGIECLRHIKSDDDLSLIPVIMLTTSREDTDRVLSYKLGCNTFIQKPVDFPKFAEAVNGIQSYWSLSELP